MSVAEYYTVAEYETEELDKHVDVGRAASSLRDITTSHVTSFTFSERSNTVKSDLMIYFRGWFVL